MFTRADLSTLLESAPSPAVSIFLPTHVRGGEVRQGPIRLRNLAAEAGAGLAAAGLTAAETERILRPALALVEDHEFWQHRDQGLALFLDADGARRFTVPIPLAEDVTVGTGFRVRPLLPVLAADGAFLVVAVTAYAARLFDASRFAVTEIRLPDVPSGPDEPDGSDYENPVRAGPPARPHTGTANISHAQVYGDSPPEWREARLVEYVRKVAAAVRRRLAADRAEAVGRVEALLGRQDPRAATGLGEVAAAAHQGRVDTLLLVEQEPTPGGRDRPGGPAGSGHDLAEAAAVRTLQAGGTVHVLPREGMPAGGPVAAILRY